MYLRLYAQHAGFVREVVAARKPLCINEAITGVLLHSGPQAYRAHAWPLWRASLLNTHTLQFSLQRSTQAAHACLQPTRAAWQQAGQCLAHTCRIAYLGRCLTAFGQVCGVDAPVAPLPEGFSRMSQQGLLRRRGWQRRQEGQREPG